MKTFKLRSCPFCGSEHVYIINENIAGVPKYAECYHCQARTKDYYTEKEAQEAWNCRTHDLDNVEPVIHARWEMVEVESFWIQNMQESLETGKPTKAKLPVCSHCKTRFGTLALEYKRCPECGAIMDLKG